MMLPFHKESLRFSLGSAPELGEVGSLFTMVADRNIHYSRHTLLVSYFTLPDLRIFFSAFPEGFLGIDETKATCVGFL